LRNPIQSLGGGGAMPMNELVLSLHRKLISALRLPSFAGNGLTERMRSTSFALLGLTAAAGLALVAIFAQPGFSLISPAPLPDEPSIGESIGNARKLPLGHNPVALVSARPAPALRANGESSASGAPSGGVPGHSSEPVQGQSAPAETTPPAPVPSPTSAPGPSGGQNPGGGNKTGDTPSPAPTTAPQPAATTPSSPTSSPHPSSPKPEAVTSAPKPEPVPAPGNSSSTAAAEHASERGIEASAGTGPPAAAPATASVAPESPTSPGNGNGLAKGHDK
jgi:hypothetical protein